MSKRKRPKFGNPAREAERAAASEGAFNRMARRSCSECGAPVEWITADQAAQRGIDLSAGMKFLGLTEIAGENVWACTRCDNFGIMEPW